MKDKKTINYYENNADIFIENTADANMSEAHQRFRKYLPMGASVLDAGCGSGRDSLAFLELGYQVVSMDASLEMCKATEALTGQKVLCLSFDEIKFQNDFDGIWACASLLHIDENNLPIVLNKLVKALKQNGIFYASWKYGEFERVDGERFYCDLNEERLQKFISDIGALKILECWMSDDVLKHRREQKWLNIIMKKE